MPLMISWDSPWVLRLGWTILHSVWEVLVLAAILAMCLPLLRRRSPQAAYAGSCLALLMSLLLPVGTFLVVTESIESEPPIAGTSIAVAGPPRVENERNGHESFVGIESATSDAEVEPQVDSARARPANPPVPVHKNREAAWALMSRLNSTIAAYLPWIVGIWACGVCLLSIWNCGVWIAVQRLKSQATVPVAESLERAANRIARQLGLSSAARLLKTALIESPCVIGAWRPVILLPAALVSELPPAQLESLIAHELAHVLRRDYAVNLLQTAMETLFFYHPGIWWISAQIRQDREHCCDDLAVRFAPNRADYLTALAAVAGLRTPAIVPAATSGRLLTRFQRLCGISPSESTHPARWAAGLIVLACCGIMIGVSMLPQRTVIAETQQTTTDDAQSKDRIPLLKETGEFELRLVGPDGKPAPEAMVEIRTNPHPTEEQILRGKFVRKANYGSFASADAEGRLVIAFPETPGSLNLSIITPGYAPYWAQWHSGDHEEPIPAAFAAELEAGWSVGGIVTDDAGHPLVNVTIHPNIKFKKRPGDLGDLHTGTRIKTDAVGRWRFDSVPESNLKVFVEINHADFMPLRRPLQRSEFGIERGQEPVAKIEMDRGLIVTGKVTDDAGNPIAGALIRTQFHNDLRQATTDQDGNYQLSGCEPRTAKIVVSAKGKATDMQELLISPEMEPVDFEMQPGGKVHIQVLDDQGNPAPKSRIFFQRWRGNRFEYFEFDHVHEYADENGRWEWNEAPLDEFRADICPPNGMQLGKQRLIARAEPYIFRTPPALVVSGKVVDTETGQPIAKFQVIPGVRYESGQLGWMRREQLNATDGNYRMRQTYDRDAYLVRIEADGYQAAVSRDIQSDEGQITIDFKLNKASEIVAQVVTPQGDPAGGAQVALGIAGSQIAIKNGEFLDTSTFCARQKADNDGRFRFPAQEMAYQLVILHPAGYAHVKVTPEEQLSTITLNPWAQVEGTFFVGQDPVPQAAIEIHSSGLHSYGEDVPRMYTQHETIADEHGHYKFSRVFPGRAGIGRRIQLTVENGAEDVSSSCRIPVNFPGGEVTHMNLGGTGRPVIGTFQPPEGFKERINWNFALIDAAPHWTMPPKPADPEIPEDVEQDVAKKAEWLLKWRLTDEGKNWTAWQTLAEEFEKRLEASPRFTATVRSDGTFCIDDVPAGNYEMTTRFDRNGGVFIRNHRFTVPPMEGNRSDEPLDLGVLRLQQ